MKNHKLFNEINSLSKITKIMFNMNHCTGLNRTQERVLILISINKDNTMGEINDLIGIGKGSFTNLIDNLIKMQLVERERSNKDKRKIKLVLTHKGINLSNAIISLMDKHLDNILSNFSDKYIDNLFKTLKILNEFTKEVKI